MSLVDAPLTLREIAQSCGRIACLADEAATWIAARLRLFTGERLARVAEIAAALQGSADDFRKMSLPGPVVPSEDPPQPTTLSELLAQVSDRMTHECEWLLFRLPAFPDREAADEFATGIRRTLAATRAMREVAREIG